jgi:crooked neck
MPPKGKKFTSPASAAMRRSAVRDLRASKHQISAEQLLAEAHELRQITRKRDTPVLTITSKAELAVYRQSRREEFEKYVKQNYKDFGKWLAYAKWEETDGDPKRAVDVWERAIPTHGALKELWRYYAELCTRHATFEKTESVFSRATTALPQEHELWLKYLLFTQAAHDDDRTRVVFERWLRSSPPLFAYELACRFECSRHHQREGIELLLQRMVSAHNVPRAWLFYAVIEHAELGDTAKAVHCCESALRELKHPFEEPRLVVLLIRLLMMSKGHEDRIDQLFRMAMESADPHACRELLPLYATFQRGNEARQDSSQALGKEAANARARFVLSQRLQRNRTDGDAVAEYFRACENSPEKQIAALRDACSEPLKNTEAFTSDVHLQQRASIVLKWAEVLESLSDHPHAHQVLLDQLKSFPHERLTNEDLWLSAAKFSAQRQDFHTARNIFGAAIARCGSLKIFERYIAMETALWNTTRDPDAVDRCRSIFQTCLADHYPHSVPMWAQYAEFESSLGEHERAVAVFEKAVRVFQDEINSLVIEPSDGDGSQWPHYSTRRLSLLESLDDAWMSYIRHHSRFGRVAEVTALYRRLLATALDEYKLQFLFARRSSTSAVTSLNELAERCRGKNNRLLLYAAERLVSALDAASNFMMRHIEENDVAEKTERVRTEIFVSNINNARRLGCANNQEHSFMAASAERDWTELFLAPLFDGWRKFEARHGTLEALQKVGEAAVAPTQKRTRLRRT